ncbi:GOLPH3/VPS74 family protein, partial [Saccharomonospora halophila]|uniref:GOLPH3/VPS74 family protein n=1 Tax=Saccharomonospora halophila TaxID=129922 RepID=UPI000376C0FA
MLIAEDLALLLAEGDTGASGTATPRGEYSLAGALLIELALLDRVDVTGGTHPVDAAPRTPDPDGTGDADGADGAGAPDPPTTGRLVVRDPASTGHPALDSALAVLTTLESARPKDAVGALAQHAVSTDLRSAPESGTADLDRLRARLREVLLDGREPDERTTALIALLTGTDAVGGALGP